MQARWLVRKEFLIFTDYLKTKILFDTFFFEFLGIWV